jgi:hypothetical protein
MHSHWQKQGKDPLFPNLVWARPETKATAGKLFVIGGTGQSFAGAAEAYQQAEKAGIGSVRVMLPHSLEKTVGKLFPAAEFAPATPSGSFAVSALAELLDASSWADGVVIAADTGNNSETIRLFEAFLEKYAGQLTLSGATVETLMTNPSHILDRPETTLVLTLEQLQKLAVAARHTEAFTSEMGLLMLVERLVDFNKLHAAHLVITYGDIVAVAADGHISTTERADRPTTNALAAHAATWWLQTPTDPFAALTTAICKH